MGKAKPLETYEQGFIQTFKLRNIGRGKRTEYIFILFQKQLYSRKIISYFLRMGRTNPHAGTAIDASFMDDYGTAILYLDSFHRASPDTFVAIPTFSKFSIDRIYHDWSSLCFSRAWATRSTTQSGLSPQ
jgi:hypothetical protein